MVEKKIAGVTCHLNQTLLHRFTASLRKEWLVILLPEITLNFSRVKLKGKYSHLFIASKTGNTVTNGCGTGNGWNSVGKYGAVLGRHPSVPRPDKFIQDSRHGAWHCQVHLLGYPQRIPLGCTASLGEPHQRAVPSACPPYVQIPTPSRSAHLSFIIILSFVFRLHCELFEGSRPVSSVFLQFTPFLPCQKAFWPLS